MINLKKIFYCFFSFIFLLFFSCSNGITPSDKKEEVIEKDNTVFVNNTNFVVKIFSDSIKTSLVAELESFESKSCNVDIALNGNVFYCTYFLLINDVLIPYGEGEKIVNLTQGNTLTINIGEPSKIYANKNVVVLRNASSSAIAFCAGNTELIPENKKNTLLNEDEYGIYILNSNNVSEYKILDAKTTLSIEDIEKEENGYIYSFIYNGKEIVLQSKLFLDLSIQQQIWKISLSQDYGKTLLAGKFTNRNNPDDGYMLFGRQVYSNDYGFINNSKPYYTFIGRDGEIEKEQVLVFKDNPLDVRFRAAIDTGNYILACGNKLSSANISSSFIIGLEGRSINKDIRIGSETVYEEMQTMIQKKEDTFCILSCSENYSSSEWSDENYLFSSFALIEATVESYNSVSTKLLWESNPEDSLICVDLYYDVETDVYAVLYYDEESEKMYLSFIDASDGNKLSNDISLDNFDFIKMKKGINNNVFLCGAFENQITGVQEACIREIDFSSKTLSDRNVPLFPSKDNSLSSYFNDLIVKDDYLILAGSTDYLNTGELDDVIPYIVAYDYNRDKILWERKFDELKGYKIYSCDNSETSFIYELYNETTCHSYIVSAGLLGEIPETIKVTLPYNESINYVDVPDVNVYFYDSYFEESSYDETKFKFLDEIEFEDLSEFVPSDIQKGYKITGWYNWDSSEEKEEIIFPYKLETSELHLYPKLEKTISTIYIYEDYLSTNYNSVIEEFNKGEVITIDELSALTSVTIPENYILSGWAVWNGKSEGNELEFPYKLETSELHLYPKFEKMVVNVYLYASSDAKNCVEVVKYDKGDTIILVELEKFNSYFEKGDFVVTGWRIWNGVDEGKDLEFPYVLNEELHIYPVLELKKNVVNIPEMNLDFRCDIKDYGSSGIFTIDLLEPFYAYEGETFEISGEIEFGTPSGGVINQFFIQECVSYSAPLGYNVIVDYESETGLAGRKESFSGEWVVSPEQVGMHSNFEFFLTWQSDDGNEADEICNLILKNFQIKRK